MNSLRYGLGSTTLPKEVISENTGKRIEINFYRVFSLALGIKGDRIRPGLSAAFEEIQSYSQINLLHDHQIMLRWTSEIDRVTV